MKSLTFFLFFSVSVLSSAQQEVNPCPCCTEAHRQFDFWLGQWEVDTPKGPAGTSRIELIQDSCVIMENWISAKGNYTGTSFNYYNTTTKQWNQLWLDNQGAPPLELLGGIKDGKMVLESRDLVDAKGQQYRDRISWTPNKDGSVRQHWQRTSDSGKTWQTLFDGLYKKKN